MLVHAKYFLNDSFSTINSIENQVTSKFEFLSSNPANSYLTLELWNLRINRRVIKRSEYNVSTANLPLTSIKVGAGTGAGGEPVTLGSYLNPSTSPGFDNYTKFINRIFAKHGISSRFFPMGKNYAPNPNNSTFFNVRGNQIGCHLSLLEDFSLTFLERPTNIGAGTFSYSQSAMFHIETVAPMTLRGQVRDYNRPIEFNSLVSPYNSTNILTDYTNFYTDRRYLPA